MRSTILLLALATLVACGDDQGPTDENGGAVTVELSTHDLAAFTRLGDGQTLVVFEAGLGDDHGVWDEIAGSLDADVILYDRAGYGASTSAPAPRDVPHLSADLEQVIDALGDGRDVVLVAHSLGGMVIRDYAIRNPERVAGMLFVDPSHELYNRPTQAQEDMLVDAFAEAFGSESGAAAEARELIEDTRYLETLADLPDVPVVVLTSMKLDQAHDEADRQLWFDAHEALGRGLTHFEHIAVTDAGHYIMLEAPDMVRAQLQSLLD